MNTSSPNQYTNYCYKLGLLLFGVYLALAAFNAWVDPRGYFILSNENKARYFIAPTRVEKSIRLAREQYDVIAIGSSRVEVGIDPESKWFEGKSVYNLGLSATNMYELHDVIDYVLANQKPETIILGLDFLMFTSQREYHPDFQSSLFSKNTPYVLLLAKYLANTDVLKESILSLMYREKSKPSNINSRGFLDKGNAQVNHRDLFNTILSQNFFVRKDTYAGFVYSKEREQILAAAIEKIIHSGINLKIFFSPIHARQEEALAVGGLYETYETWKIEVLNIIAKYSNEKLRMCDFSGYTKVTTEPIPERAGEPMKWYWESSHYKKELGDRIIALENIGSHLQAIRGRQEVYRREFPFEVQEVYRIFSETAAIRAHNVHQSNGL
jgi:hypothetical protein